MPKPTLYRTWQSYDAKCDDPTVIRYDAPIQESDIKPGSPANVKSRWCCPSQECAVCDVQITFQIDEHILAAMKCPVCGGNLSFLHYLEERALEPVDWTGVGRKSA